MEEGAPGKNSNLESKQQLIDGLRSRIESIENVIQNLLQNNSVINSYNDLLDIEGLYLEKGIQEHPDVVFFETLRSMQNMIKEDVELIKKE